MITHGVDYKALKYKREHDYVWVDFRALIDEHECDYPLGSNEILEVEYARGYWVKIVRISLGIFNCESDA